MPSPVYNNFQNLITFSRASNATLVDATGRITYAPNNLFVQSQTFNTTWTKTDVTVTENTTVAPDGTTTADTATEGTAGTAQLRQDLTVNAGVTVAFSFYLKRGNTDWVSVNCAFSVNNFTAWVNLATGALGTASSGGTGVLINASVTSVGDNWYRVSLVGRMDGITSYRTYLRTATANASATPVANGSYIVWGAQAELVTYQTTPSTYNPTTTAAYYGPRLDYDPATLALKGLLVEEARTNVLTYSEQFDNAFWVKTRAVVTANATIAPDGTLTADKLAVDTTAATTHRLNGQTTLSAISYTLSLYAKKSELNYLILQINTIANSLTWFDLNAGTISTLGSGVTAAISNVGNGWYRCSITGTSTAGTADAVIYPAETNGVSTTTVANGTSGIFIWGAQLEAGAFATSYIPTVAASVARSADIASMTGSQFAPWYNRNAGTFVMSLQTQYSATSGLGITPTFINLNIGVSGEGYVGYYNGLALSSYDGTNIANATMATWAPLTKFASAYGGATKSLVVNNGTLVSTAYNGAWSAGNQLTTAPRAWIQSITYYPRTLSNSQLQSLTS